MKLDLVQGEYMGLTVAPRRGAWIETLLIRFPHLLSIVAPRRGAWIETTARVIAGGRAFGRTRRGAWMKHQSI